MWKPRVQASMTNKSSLRSRLVVQTSLPYPGQTRRILPLRPLERMQTLLTTRRGSHQPDAYFREKLYAVFDKSPEELGLIETAERPAAGEAGDLEEKR